MGLLRELATIEHLYYNLSSPNDYIGDPRFKIWIPDYTLGNDGFTIVMDSLTKD